VQIADELRTPFAGRGLDGKTEKVCAMLKNVDDNFGRLRAALREAGLEENTLLIFTSDNGPCSGSISEKRFMAGLHGLKGTVYENGIRVPCYMRWPSGFSAPARVERLTAHIDVMPTVLEACGAAAPAGVKFDGVSLMPLLRNPSANWPDRTLFIQWDSGKTPRRGHAFAVLTERWKLVQPTGMDKPVQQLIRDRYAELCKAQGRGNRTIEGPPRHELYDLPADAGETRDVAAAHPEIAERMRKQYDAWFTDVAARWLEPSPTSRP
jgi:arylsulfatase A-like enzyme